MKQLWLIFLASEGLHNFRRNRLAVFGAVILALFFFIAVFGPWLTPQNPYNPKELDLNDAFKPPAWESGDSRFLLGTDQQGRDLLSGIVYGVRISILVGVLATLFSLVIGTVCGLVAGYRGGWPIRSLCALRMCSFPFPGC